MGPMYISIQQKETGKRIKKLLAENGYTVKDIQGAMGFENPQAVYKWVSGRSLPSLDNFIILSKLLHTSIEDILVIDGDIILCHGKFFIDFFEKYGILSAWGISAAGSAPHWQCGGRGFESHMLHLQES